MLVNEKKLAFYVERNLNVLFEGERGVGKTSVIYKTFNEAGLRIKYFSAPTMDPWTDLVGVPTKVTRNDGKEVLRMIPPEDFADDKYDVIFIDELNRAPPKVLDALMELIQFKTINGKPYNIKMIWAAINPYSEDNNDYQVEPLDKALKDRFQIHIKFPYTVDESFFKKNHGETGVVFCEWWKSQPKEIQKEISPRRLFDTTTFYVAGGDIEDMITVGNVDKLKQNLKTVTHFQILQKEFTEQNIVQSKSILKGEYSPVVRKFLLNNKETFDFFFEHINQEFLAQEFIKKKEVYGFLIENAKNNDSKFNSKSTEIIQSIISISSNKFLKDNNNDLEQFIPTEKKEAIAQQMILSPLMSTSSAEGNFLKALSKYTINGTNIPATAAIKVCSKYQLGTLLPKEINKAISKGLTIERITEQIVTRMGLYLAMHYATSNNTTDASTKIVSMLTYPKHTSYVWPKEYSHFGEKIRAVFDNHKDLTPDEIHDTFTTLTSKNKIKNKPSKPI